MDGHADRDALGVHHRDQRLLDLAVPAERRECRKARRASRSPGWRPCRMLARRGAAPRDTCKGENPSLVGFGAMSVPSDPDLLVLLTLRLRAIGRPRRSPTPSGSGARGHRSARAGSRPAWSALREGPLSGWTLTAAGRAEGERCCPTSSTRPGPGVRSRRLPAVPGHQPGPARRLHRLAAPHRRRRRGGQRSRRRRPRRRGGRPPAHPRRRRPAGGRRPGRGARTLRWLRAPPGRRPGQGPGRRRRLVHQADHRLVPHRVVRAAREPAGHARHRALHRTGHDPTAQEAT